MRATVNRASLLVLVAGVVMIQVSSASLRASSRCPSPLDCAKERRRFCEPGSSQCGPCLYALEEDEDGLCVARKRHHQKSESKVYPDLDEEIDFLHSVIEKHKVTEVRPAPKQNHNFAAIPLQSDVRTTQAAAPEEEVQNVQSSTTAPTSTTVTTREGKVGPIVTPKASSDNIIIILISVCVIAGTMAVILAAVCAVKLHRDSRLTQKVDYPAFGGATVAPVKANGTSQFGDHTLAQNAAMFHYQHQKQQMLSMGNQKPEPKAVDTDVTSDEEDVGGDFTVYECPGLAPTGEMEVKNPLFDDSTLPYQGNHH